MALLWLNLYPTKNSDLCNINEYFISDLMTLSCAGPGIEESSLSSMMDVIQTLQLSNLTTSERALMTVITIFDPGKKPMLDRHKAIIIKDLVH